MANKNVTKGVNTLNTASSQEYKNVVPVANASNLNTIKDILLDQNYTPQYNEFVRNLFNRVFLTIINNKSFNNPLADLKKGSYPLGTDIQEIFTNPVTGEKYQLNKEGMEALLKLYTPETHVAYYRRNRQDKYPISVSRENLQSAFTSWENFNEYISSITNALYSSNYIDEYELTKKLIDDAYSSGYANTLVVSNPTDTDSLTALTEQLRKIYLDFTVPSTENDMFGKMSTNGEKIKTWTTSDRIVVVISNELAAKLDVRVLANAFNIDHTKLMGRIHYVDKFQHPEIKALICDESFFQIYDNILRFDEFYNGSTMVWNWFLHAWGTWNASPFAPMCLLVTKDSSNVTNISFGSEPINITGVGETKELDVTLTPSDTTDIITYTSDNESIFKVTSYTSSHVTIESTGVGEANLTATSESGVTASVTVKVTGS